MAGDLHTRKDSHVALPFEAKTEWHLEDSDVNIPVKPDKRFMLVIPVICTSADAQDSRFRQIAKPFLEDRPVFGDKPAAKDKSEKTKHGGEVERYNESK